LTDGCRPRPSYDKRGDPEDRRRRADADCPEIDPASIDPGASLRDDLDLDSMDFLNFVLAVDDRLGVAIPEADYSRLATLDGVVAYLAGRLERPGKTSSRP
jgi:acyl carrier protein